MWRRTVLAGYRALGSDFQNVIAVGKPSIRESQLQRDRSPGGSSALSQVLIVDFEVGMRRARIAKVEATL